MSATNGEWKVNQAKFQGYMKANIENIKEELKEMKEKNGRLFKDLYDKHEYHDRKIVTIGTKITLIVTGTATVVSIIAAAVIQFVKRIFN